MLRLLFFAVVACNVCIFGKERESCDNIICSKTEDPICGSVTLSNGKKILRQFFNKCTFLKTKCVIGGPTVVVEEVSGKLCGLKANPMTSMGITASGRRVADFTVLGAHQYCNHSCPIHCTDAYEPSCMSQTDGGGSTRIMLNHCHVDMYSCVTGLRVKIQPLFQCSVSGTKHNFMMIAASLQSMGLIDSGRGSIRMG